jgi:membrane-associated phospholipid phosphatase
MGTDTLEKKDEELTPPKQKASPRKRWFGGAAVALVIAVTISALAYPEKRGVGGLPPPIGDAQGASKLMPPASIGSAFETSEVNELLTILADRTEDQEKEARYWQAGAVTRWNEIARGLVARYGTNAVNASRAFALLSVAHHDTMLAVIQEQRLYKRPAPAKFNPLFAVKTESTYPSEHAAIAAASAVVLGFVFNNREQKEGLAKRAEEHTESRLRAGVSRRSDVTAGIELGREVAFRIIERAKDDGADRSGINWRGEIPVGPDKWKSSEVPAVVPVRPLWGAVRPWLMTSGAQFRPPSPPAVDSPEFAKAIAELRDLSKARTPEQLKIAQLWSDAPGTQTAPGHWNEIASEHLVKHGASELSSARTLALMNMAVMDAGIGCWEAKYHYWYLRPTQVDPTITTPAGLPNFPSYPSGHSCFSGAAAGVLGHFFPDAKAELDAKAEEASVSRIYGGIHFRFDGAEGLKLGRSVAALAIEKAKAEPAVP